MTYPGQQITCKYCGEPGLVKLSCKKCLLDYSKSKQNSDSNSKKHLLLQSAENTTAEIVLHYSEATDLNFQLNYTNDKLINLSRKRKLNSDSDIDLPECKLTLLLKMTTKKKTLSADADPKLQCNVDFLDSFLCEKKLATTRKYWRKLVKRATMRPIKTGGRCHAQSCVLTCRSENMVADTVVEWIERLLLKR